VFAEARLFVVAGPNCRSASLIGQACIGGSELQTPAEARLFVGKLLTLGVCRCFAIVIGATGLIVGGNYDRAISAAVLIVGIVGASCSGDTSGARSIRRRDP